MPSPRVGVIGAGQLARMLLPPAIDLDVGLAVLAASAEDGAAQVAADVTVGADLATFAAGCDVVTFDHELVDPDVLAAAVDAGARFEPSPAALRYAQDKAYQRHAFSRHGLPVPEHDVAADVDAARQAGETLGFPLVVKAPRGGYDGRGVALAADVDALAEAVAAVGGGPVLCERQVELTAELAVLVVTSPSGDRVVYPPVFTVQEDGICTELLCPAPLPPAVLTQAAEVARAVADVVGATGVLAIELFVEGEQVLINEVATRPHNSGHWTIEGAHTSQFANHLRAVLDWPLGSPELACGAVATVNVLGPADGSDPRTRRAAALAIPATAVHLYGKHARAGRKLGHVTARAADLPEARRRAHTAADLLTRSEPRDVA